MFEVKFRFLSLLGNIFEEWVFIYVSVKFKLRLVDFM